MRQIVLEPGDLITSTKDHTNGDGSRITDGRLYQVVDHVLKGDTHVVMYDNNRSLSEFLLEMFTWPRED